MIPQKLSKTVLTLLPLVDVTLILPTSIHIPFNYAKIPFVRSLSSFNLEVFRRECSESTIFCTISEKLINATNTRQYRCSMCLRDRVSSTGETEFLRSGRAVRTSFGSPLKHHVHSSSSFFLLPSSLSLLSPLFSLSRSRQRFDLPCARTRHLQAIINQRYFKRSYPSCNKSS